MLKIRSKVCCHFGRVLPTISLGRALLITTCFRAYNMQARSTANRKIRRKIQNSQMFETDPESFSPAINSTNQLKAD
jgi:hypothetical protein